MASAWPAAQAGGEEDPRGARRGTTLAPLYRRLPRGPHGLAREEVARHQRARLHGAMIEAVATSGYRSTTVTQVILLAGVSRRCFYEQFANRQECLLSAFDVIVARAGESLAGAYLAAEGHLEERLGAAFDSIAASIRTDAKGARLVLVEARRGGVAGSQRTHSLLSCCEQLLTRALGQRGGPGLLPRPVVRAIVGGLYGQCASALRPEPATAPDIGAELLDWTLQLCAPPASTLPERMAAGVDRRVRAVARARAGAGACRASEGGSLGERTSDWDALAHELAAIADGAGRGRRDWGRGVRVGLGALLVRVAEHPQQARALLRGREPAGPGSEEPGFELSRALVRGLLAGSPDGLPQGPPFEALAGALWHTLDRAIEDRRTALLAAVGDYLTYVLLTPCIGAEAAIEIASEEPRAARSDRPVPQRPPVT